MTKEDREKLMDYLSRMEAEFTQYEQEIASAHLRALKMCDGVRTVKNRLSKAVAKL